MATAIRGIHNWRSTTHIQVNNMREETLLTLLKAWCYRYLFKGMVSYVACGVVNTDVLPSLLYSLTFSQRE